MLEVVERLRSEEKRRLLLLRGGGVEEEGIVAIEDQSGSEVVEIWEKGGS
jgi:hypothetical protein